MKSSQLFSGLFILVVILIVTLHYRVHDGHDNHGMDKAKFAALGLNDLDATSPAAIEALLRTIRAQNDTITILSQLMEQSVSSPSVSSASSTSTSPSIHQTHELVEALKHKDAEIEMLRSKLEQSQHAMNAHMANTQTNSPSSQIACNNSIPTSMLAPYMSSSEADCEMRYGLSLIQTWRQNAQTWCKESETTTVPPDLRSELKCFRYHQPHKKLDGRGPDMFCEAKNFFIDFSRVSGDAGPTKPHLGTQYLSFQTGSISATCTRTNHYHERHFMPHHSLQMSTFQNIPTPPPQSSYTVEDTTTYLLARDEDCENSFHSTADFMNMFLVMEVLGVKPSEQQVMLFDRHPDGPYVELLTHAYTTRPLIRHQHYKGKKILFKRLIFHLESPAGLIFPRVSRPGPLLCHSTSLFQAYRKFVLQAFNLYDVKPPVIPSIILSLRHRTPHKNVGRVMANEDEVVNVLKEGNLINYKVVDTAKYSYKEQLTMIRNSNILVGIHGAGLMFIMFAAEEAILIEIHPSYRQDRHFRHASRMTGKIYMPIRSLTRETCHGTSDNVRVDIDEFRRTLDGAVRIARSFDDGLSECGLKCPPQVLALDEHLNPHYKEGEMRSAPINTIFPCG